MYIYLTVSISRSLENTQFLFLPRLTYCIPSICRDCNHLKIRTFLSKLLKPMQERWIKHMLDTFTVENIMKDFEL